MPRHDHAAVRAIAVRQGRGVTKHVAPVEALPQPDRRSRTLARPAPGQRVARRYAVTLGLALAFGITRGIRRWTQSAATANGWGIVGADCLEAVLVGFALLFALEVADRVADRRGTKWASYVGAGLVAPALGVAIARGVWSASALCDCGPRLYAMDVAIGYFGWVVLTVLTSLAYAYSRQIRRRHAALRAVQLERELLQRNASESRLQAMQARVEPQFLFGTLAQVDALYATDAQRADRVLDDLITYLRAALPRLRGTTTTLRAEYALARAYLDIVRLRLGDRFSFAVAAPEHAEDVRMPPMILLPLINHAIAALPSDHACDRFHIGARLDGGRVRIDVTDGNGAFALERESAAIRGMRERLVALYPGRGTLTLERDPPDFATRCVIEIPHERA